MKTNAITRIIIFSLVIVILLGILLVGLGVGMFVVNIQNPTGYETVESTQGSVSAEDIRKIEIEWASGTIDIQVADVDAITFRESGSYADEQQMVWKQTGDTLIICYSKPAIQIGFFSYSDKDLTVILPRDWQCSQLTLDVASADIHVTDLNADLVDINTASGECDFLNCIVEDLDIDTASGSIYYEGTLNTLDCDAASACFEGYFANTPRRIQMDSASGDLDIILPDDCGFEVTMDALSGQFNSDFPASYNGKTYTYGDESCRIDFDGASGSVRIRRAE